MLYTIEFILLVGCILIFSAGIVWAFGCKDYSKNPLHRLYCLLSAAYLRVSDFLVKGWDALREGKNKLGSRIFGSRSVPFAADRKNWKAEQYAAGSISPSVSGFLKSGKYNMKVLK
ncbi:MAG TPA: hypothetical protein H9734_06965 [Candidatus Fusicatenibacter merdavium]|uniref:Uncharacterized protein n=1 Tax=Candidatus Fusicatenibacter merdavium TaxID=2838600 RepID=A0A9D1XDY3_9FIRM|nr:hypothetical protein [Candidatus Fusicatenibacter merdavium]